MTRPIVEVCVASVAECVIAESAGADRLELNCSLPLGGLTPSPALVLRALQACQLPVIAMVRPRPGGFAYDADDWKTLLDDSTWFIEAGVHGLAFGCLHADRSIDVEKVQQLRSLFPDSELVFHRAFDLVDDWKRAINQLVDCGIKRVMTSGFAKSVPDGLTDIANVIKHAGSRIEILPAGGINDTNALEVVKTTGCSQIHGTFSTVSEDPGYLDAPVRFAPNDSIRRTDGDKVAATVATLEQAFG